MTAPRPIWVFAAIALFVVAILLFVCLRVHRQVSAVRAIESHGGAVGTACHRPDWQRHLLGYPTFKLFETPEFVNWEHAAITDASLDPLLSLPTLRRLNLQHTGITDVGLARLKELSRLELLLLEGTAVTDAGIADLQQALPRLSVKK